MRQGLRSFTGATLREDSGNPGQPGRGRCRNMEEPGFDANDEVWRCAPPCFFELCYGECYKCGKVYPRTSDMEDHDGEVSP